MLNALVSRRRKILNFSDKNTDFPVLMQIIKNHEQNLQELRINVNLKHFKKTEFEALEFRPKCLRMLDLSRVIDLGDLAF